MQQAPPNVPQPREESDEPTPIIQGEARYEAKEEPANIGEYVARQRQRELEQGATLLKEQYEGGATVRAKMAAGKAAKDTADAKRAAAAAVVDRRRAEQAEADKKEQERVRTSQLRSSRRGPHARRLGAAAAGQTDQDAQKQVDALQQKFVHAKVELDKAKKKEETTINSMRNEAKQLESELARESRLTGMYERTEQLGERKTKQLEDELDELTREERELAGTAKRDAKVQSELRRVRRKVSDLNFKIRLAERTATTGQGRQRTNESKQQEGKRRLIGLQKKIAAHESQLALIEQLQSDVQAKKSAPNLVQAWHDVEQDLQNKLGIRIYR